MFRRLIAAVLAAAPIAVAWPEASGVGEIQHLAGLQGSVTVTRDTHGIMHIRALSESDLFFMQGWLHARDRLFQMDTDRRVASGTLAELLGTAALPQDVQFRTIGLRRAAERSLGVLSAGTRAGVEAYARGVNAYVAAHALPPEYAALGITRFVPWTPLDSVALGKLFSAQLSLEFDIDSTVALASYQQAGAQLGFDGQALYFEDLDRAAPFDRASTIPDATRAIPPDDGATRGPRVDSTLPHPTAIELARRWRDDLAKAPALSGMLERRQRPGSNEWAVSGRLTASGRPIIANDPHLSLSQPAIWYPIGLEVPEDLLLYGASFPGTPGVVIGYNAHLAWGATNTGFDVSDTYQEQLVPDPSSPSGLSTLYKGRLEPVIPVPEVFQANVPGAGPDHVVVVPPGNGIPAFTLIVPRRNNGPIVRFDASSGIALSLQWTGFSATREFDAVFGFDHASTLEDFVSALQYFNTGSQNFVVADDLGNIAYYTSGEVPVREDLQANTVNGLPPHFIRNGQGGNEWLPVQHPQPHQAGSYEVLPFAELPQIVNPAAGFFVNANNDPIGVTLGNHPLGTQRPGGGIYYLSWTFDDPSGLRPGQITERLRGLLAEDGHRVTIEDMQSIQADVTLRDAELFVPWIAAAFERAGRTGSDPALVAAASAPGVAAAVMRLRRWDRTSPTGLLEGWDAGKRAGVMPSAENVENSIGATLYTAWRSRFVHNTIDRVIGGVGLPLPDEIHTLSALRNLLENFASRGGRGVSGVDFFPLRGVASADDRRDVVLLASLSDALAMLASDAFNPAFGGSTDLQDYRWGKLHRIVFASVLGAPFSIPPAGRAFPAPLPGLAGIPTDGGFETVDAAHVSVRGSTPDDFMFSHGPSRRFVAEVAPHLRTRAADSLPGGTSGVLGSPFYFQLLPGWLANEAVTAHLGSEQLEDEAAEAQQFVP